ncbi:hypothetical protein CPter291_2702 [Collimonas pratensis]|uniref:DUF4236 domain-containing protein n=1 Tax=Collimonas pratensis TaxID=279113 RepID=A0ABN4MEF1_9BURK|nr:hypothetical protein CPter291_2702 [Collimonas pratensis]
MVKFPSGYPCRLVRRIIFSISQSAIAITAYKKSTIRLTPGSVNYSGR